MTGLPLRMPEGGLREILLLGAHADDIEIGCGGTVLSLAEEHPGCRFTWVVLSATGEREREARVSARAFLGEGHRLDLRTHRFRDGFFPWEGRELKELLEELEDELAPELILTHQREDRHQDHRTVAELTWTAFRAHPILEYEVPKYDGELGQPNVFVPLDAPTLERKITLLEGSFPTQAARPWFDDETFRSLARLRGVEAGAKTGYAEGFHGRKLTLRP